MPYTTCTIYRCPIRRLMAVIQDPAALMHWDEFHYLVMIAWIIGYYSIVPAIHGAYALSRKLNHFITCHGIETSQCSNCYQLLIFLTTRYCSMADESSHLTDWSWDKMDAVKQITFFILIVLHENVVFWCKSLWNLFPKVPLGDKPSSEVMVMMA